jgi:hypothetical protein
MRARFLNVFKASAVSAAMLAVSTLTAGAADLGLMVSPGASARGCSDIVLTCANGREYPICPIAVSVAGELVTASVHTGHRRSTYVRLVPMGVGYRYAGKGFWIDGWRENASVNFGNNSSVACTVQRS